MSTQDSGAKTFEYWREVFQKSIDAWAQAAGAAGTPFAAQFFGAPAGGTTPGFGPAAGPNPFGQFAPPLFTHDLQQMWQQFFNSWAEQAQKAMAAGTEGPEAMFNAQKQWSEQLEAMAKTFAEVMGTESFASMLGRYMEQTLVWQQRMANASEPQMDTVLRAFNMPSRSQIDRMFERVIGLEDRIDDLEDENRRLRRQLEADQRAAATRTRGRTPKAEEPAASD